MSLSDDYLLGDDTHPINIVENLAAHNAWEFDRVTDDQIKARTMQRRLKRLNIPHQLHITIAEDTKSPAERRGHRYIVVNEDDRYGPTVAFQLLFVHAAPLTSSDPFLGSPLRALDL